MLTFSATNLNNLEAKLLKVFYKNAKISKSKAKHKPKNL